MTPTATPERFVLIIEDNPGDAELMNELLEPAEETVHVATLAAAAARLREGDVGVVLLDLHLPDGIGVECVTAIRAASPQVPIVVLTGLDDEALAIACIAAGAQDYLAKQDLRAQSLRRAIGYARARSRERLERTRADVLQARLAAIVRASPDAIVSANLQGVITSWNRGAEELFGFTAQEALGRDSTDVILAPTDASSADQRARVATLAAEGGEARDAELVRLRKDGTPMTLSVVTCALPGPEGEVVGLAGIFRDVTESKRRDDELVTRERQLRALNARLNAVREEERTRISREVHDELGQLLTGLKMDLRWISRRLDASAPESPPISTKLQEAERLVDRTIGTVQRIALELRPSALDTLGLCAALRDEARRFERRSGVLVEVSVPDIAQPSDDIATGLFRVSQELLTNVARHAQASTVRMALEQTPQQWVLRVEDDGVGVSREALRSSSSLGLLGVRERTESLGGSVTLEPATPRGTIATVRVPRTRP